MLARLVRAIWRLPSSSQAVVTKLIVTPVKYGEKWVRMFGDKALLTTQTHGGGVLCERLRSVELRFRLKVAKHSLYYDQIGVSLRLGPLSIPLPTWLWPRVHTREEADGPNRTYVSVAVSLPLAGPLISYEGHLHREEPK
jgi:hypothetical protein